MRSRYPASHLIFLDFDGVLHPSSDDGGPAFRKAPLLAKTLHGLECDIVISSSWRFHHALDVITGKLPDELSNRIIGTTGPAVEGAYARHKEILAWIQKNPAEYEWRALDDSRWEFNQCAELIPCDPTLGITEKEAGLLRAWLGGRKNA